MTIEFQKERKMLVLLFWANSKSLSSHEIALNRPQLIALSKSDNFRLVHEWEWKLEIIIYKCQKTETFEEDTRFCWNNTCLINDHTSQYDNNNRM